MHAGLPEWQRAQAGYWAMLALCAAISPFVAAPWLISFITADYAVAPAARISISQRVKHRVPLSTTTVT